MKIVWFLSLAPFCGSSEPESSGDPCTDLHPHSVCEEGEMFCKDLVWLNRLRTLYTYDPLEIVVGTSINCAEAARILYGFITGPQPEYYEVDMEEFERHKKRFDDLITQLGFSLLKFPLLTEGESAEVKQIVRKIIDDAENSSSVEQEAAGGKLTDNPKFTELVWQLDQYSPMAESASFHASMHGVLEVFALLAELVDRADMWGLPKGLILPHIDHAGYSLVLPLIDSMVDRSKELVTQLDKTVGLAVSAYMRFMSGQGPHIQIEELMGHERSLSFFSETVRLLSNPKETVPYAILRHAFESLVCPNLVPVCALLVRGFEVVGGPQGRGGHVVSSTALLCRDESDVSSRILVSAMLRKRLGSEVFTRAIVNFPRNGLEYASNMFLRDWRIDHGRDLVVVQEGAENVGYVGARKVWISQMIGKYFNAEEEDGIWEYTDDSKRFLKLTSADVLSSEQLYKLRATGRVIGYAIRYDVPMGIAFAPSFIRSLRIFFNQHEPVDPNGLLSKEDPAFLAGLSEIEKVDWTKSEDIPPAIKWTSFDRLMFQGDNVELNSANVQEFLRLSKMRKLFWTNRTSFLRLVRGITDVVGPAVFAYLTEEEMVQRMCRQRTGLPAELLINGLEWRNLENFQIQGPQVRDSLVTILQGMTDEDRFAFNMFVSGVREPPITADQGVPWIKVFLEPSLSLTSLPRAHTCHNELQLPLYTDAEVFRQKLLYAIKETNSLEGHADYGVPGPPDGT
jgi:hypothetical protein